MNDQSKEHIAVNERQKTFYETKKKNFATRIWSYFRNGLLNRIRKNVGVQEEIYDLHKSWFGDLSGKKVLDLGCYSGNSLSRYLAERSAEYIGIDLSESAIAELSEKLKDIPQAMALAMDFFSEDFIEKDFNLIYAYGVLHHFKDTEALISRLQQKLAPGGEIISYDPLETNIPVKVARKIYRPFQSDRDWEWPFTKKTYYKFDRAFEIKDRRAVLGKAKWFFITEAMPLSAKKKTVLGKKWHREDWERSRISDPYMFNCMQLTMLMKKK